MYYSCNPMCIFIYDNEVYLISTELYYLNPTYLMNSGGKITKNE